MSIHLNYDGYEQDYRDSGQEKPILSPIAAHIRYGVPRRAVAPFFRDLPPRVLIEPAAPSTFPALRDVGVKSDVVPEHIGALRKYSLRDGLSRFIGEGKRHWNNHEGVCEIMCLARYGERTLKATRRMTKPDRQRLLRNHLVDVKAYVAAVEAEIEG